MSDNVFSKAAHFVEEHPYESAGLGLVALATAGVVGRKMLANAALKEFAPSAAVEMTAGMTARAVGDGVLFSAADGTTIMARKGLVQVAAPEVDGMLNMTRKSTQIALNDGTTIRNGGWFGRGEDIWTKVPGETPIKAHSFTSDFATPKFAPITIGEDLKIAPTAVQFKGGDMTVRSLKGSDGTVDVMSGTFGAGKFEHIGRRQFEKDGVTFTPRGFAVRESGWKREKIVPYSTFVKDLTH